MGDITLPPSTMDRGDDRPTQPEGVERIQGLLTGEPPAPKTQGSGSAEDAEPSVPAEVSDAGDSAGADDDEGLADLLDEETDDADQQPKPAPTYKVKVDGEEVEVTLEEALKGYSRQADYTRKTQAIAEESKKLAAEAESMREARAKYAVGLEKLQKSLDAVSPKEPDWDALRAELSPSDFQSMVTEWQIQERRREKLANERERVEQEMHAEQQAQLVTVLQAEQQRLHEALPVLKDPEKGPAYAAKIVEYAVSQGIQREAVEKEIFAVPLLMLDKARRWDALNARKAQMTSKATKSPTAAPGAKSEPVPAAKKAQREARNQLRRSGRVQDATAVIEGILGK